MERFRPYEPRPSFFDQARCQGLASSVDFFPLREDKADGAKEICSECPVRVSCLLFALEHKERVGVWGGLTERQRQQLTRAVGKRSGQDRYDFVAQYSIPVRRRRNAVA